MNRHFHRKAEALLLAVFLFIFALPACSDQPSTKINDQILQDALVCGISMGLPGLLVAIGIDDELAWVGTAGYSDISRRVAVKPHDRFGIGSITKTFVARVILQLVEEGRLDLEKTPTDYLDLDIVAIITRTARFSVTPRVPWGLPP